MTFDKLEKELENAGFEHLDLSDYYDYWSFDFNDGTFLEVVLDKYSENKLYRISINLINKWGNRIQNTNPVFFTSPDEAADYLIG